MASRREVQYLERTPAVFPEAGALLERIFREELDMPMADRIERELAAATAAYDEMRDVIETAELDGELVGAAIVTHEQGPLPGSRFSWIGVDPSFRGRGIGRQLVVRGVEACRQRRVPVVKARAFAAVPAVSHVYWQQGFRVVAFGPTLVAGKPRETITFEKRLSPRPLAPS